MSTAASLRFPTAATPDSHADQPQSDAADLPGYAFTFMFRGGVVLLAALTNYGLEYAGFAAPWLPWVLLMPLAAMFQTIRARRASRRRPASTSAQAKTMRLLQKSFVVVILLAVASASKLGWATVHPLMLLLYAASTFAAGRVLRFRPLQLGGIACGLLGLLAAAVPADTQLLCIAAAMLVSYIVPGYLLRRQGFGA